MELIYRKGYIHTVCANILTQNVSFSSVESLSSDDYSARIDSYIGKNAINANSEKCMFVGGVEDPAVVGRAVKYGINGIIVTNSYLGKEGIRQAGGVIFTTNLLDYFDGKSSRQTTSLKQHVKWIREIEENGMADYAMSVEGMNYKQDDPAKVLSSVVEQSLDPDEFRDANDMVTSDGDMVVIMVPKFVSVYKTLCHYMPIHGPNKTYMVYKGTNCIIYRKKGLADSYINKNVLSKMKFIPVLSCRMTAIKGEGMSFINKFLEETDF